MQYSKDFKLEKTVSGNTMLFSLPKPLPMTVWKLLVRCILAWKGKNGMHNVLRVSNATVDNMKP